MKPGACIPQPEVRARLRTVVGDFTCREWQDWRWQVRHSVRSLAVLERLSVPQFVVDLPGGGGKVPLQSSHIISMTSRKAILRGFRGER